ncbi:TPA: TolC family protein [Candidatus Poribacteria bacterium]|nr:TolC family protein [Candidatus Poribacteria bacterium]
MKKILVSIFLLCLPINLSAQEKLTLTLDECIRLAIKRNEAVLQAQQELYKAEANLKIAQSDQYPQVGLTGFYEQWKNDGGNIVNGQMGLSGGLSYPQEEYKDYRAAASFSQLLLRFGGVPDFLDNAQEDMRIARIDYERAKKEAAYAVRQVFYNILLTQEEIAERRKLEAAIKQKLQRVKERRKAEILLRINVLNTELELAEQQREINELERRLDIDKTELVQLIGEDELSEVEVLGDVPEVEYTLERATKLALKNRLDLELLRGDIKRQERLVRETQWNRLLEFGGSFRYEDAKLAVQNRARTWDTVFSYDAPIFQKEPEGDESDQNEGWELRFNLGLSIFDGFRTKAEKEHENAELERLHLQLKEREKETTLEVRRAYRAVDSAKERMEIEGRVVQIRQENLRLIEALLETAQESEQYRSLTFDDVIEARSAFTNAQRVFFQARRAYAQAKEELLKAMGVME